MKNTEELKNDFFSKLIEKQDKIKKIGKNTDYILWLNEFTQRYPEFSDDDFLYQSDKVSKDDYIKICDLGILFEIINIYASKNYITPQITEFGEAYLIKLDNNAYQIGCMVGQGVLYYCKKIEISDNLSYIDYNDIVNNKTQPYVEKINDNLADFSNKIRGLYNSGVPLYVLQETATQVISELKKEEKQLELKLK